jgi:hypothetical protein
MIFTYETDGLIVANYSTKRIAKMTGLKEHVIKARRMQIFDMLGQRLSRTPKKSKPWTTAEDNIIIANKDKPEQVLCDLLPKRSHASIKRRKEFLRDASIDYLLAGSTGSERFADNSLPPW